MSELRPGTRDWDDALLGILFASTADKKAWTAALAEANGGKNNPARDRVIKQMIAHGRKQRER